MTADYEMWHAMHNDCGPYGCVSCVVIHDVEITDEILEAARILGEPLDVLVHRWVAEGMKAENA